MRILYGVTGEGMGHATRSKVVCEHLVARGHEVKIVVSGRAHSFLAKTFRDVVEIRGLTIRYVDNRMDRDGTLARNVLAAPGIVSTNVSTYFAKVARFNQQIISRCKLGKFAKQGVKVDYQLTKAFVRAKLPGCDHYVVTTFFFPTIRKKYEDTTTLVPPILRQNILDVKSRARVGDHVLVYQTSTSDSNLIDELEKVRGIQFIVYGLRRNARRGNCIIKDFSEEGFVEDLASARAVVTNGGLSLIGEAIYLGKPVFSIPVQHQFEQTLNARYIEELDYGLSADRIDAELLRVFLAEAPKYAARTAKHRQDGNRELFRVVDHLLGRLEHKAKKRAAQA
jgi:UDP:flavonoid glycosyltransferase YjiC (YdhE family)